HLPAAAGPQQFAKVGTRNAMVIAVCSFALALDPARGRVGTGIGSAGPTPLRAPEAEEFLQGVLSSEGLWGSRGPLGEAASARFGELVADAARPIDDVRGTAAYRVHALGVLARRNLTWAWAQHRTARGRPLRSSSTATAEPRQADDVWEGESLLYVLRERLGLPGSKNACEQG